MRRLPNAPANRLVGPADLCNRLRRLFPSLGRRSVMGGALEHLGSLPLTAHSSLALVRLRQETLLLGITAQSITLLSKDRDEGNSGLAGMGAETLAPSGSPLAQPERSGR